MSERTEVSNRCFALGLAFLLMSSSRWLFAEERVCPDGQRPYFGVCPQDHTPPESRSRPAPQSRPDPKPTLPQINITGIWLDQTWGTTLEITQQGETIRYIASGLSCVGGTFQSLGNGTIRGDVVESSYQARIQSTMDSRRNSEGSCVGTVSPDGMVMTSTCNDTVCGPFRGAMIRQTGSSLGFSR